MSVVLRYISENLCVIKAGCPCGYIPGLRKGGQMLLSALLQFVQVFLKQTLCSLIGQKKWNLNPHKICFELCGQNQPNVLANPTRLTQFLCQVGASG